MGRSRIAKQDDSGRVKMIYCHWYGAVTGMGRILIESYQDESKIDQLLALGDISSLGPEIGMQHAYTLQANFDTPEYANFRNMVLAYGRDRGDSETEATEWESLAAIPEDDYYEAYFYLRRGGKWYYSAHGTFTELKELTNEIVVEAIAAERAHNESQKSE